MPFLQGDVTMRIPKLCRQKTKYSDLGDVKILGQKFYCGLWGTKESRSNYLKIRDWTAAMVMFPPDDWEFPEIKRKPDWQKAILSHVEKN